MQIETDNPEIESELRAIAEEIVAQGGYLHRDLVIRCERGDFWGEMQESSVPQEVIIDVPTKLLVPYEHLGMSISDGQFAMDPDKGSLSPEQIRLGERLIHAYNLAGKPGQHQAAYPWLAYRAAPELLDRLMQARTRREFVDYLSDFLHGRPGSPSYSDFFCQTFVSTRALPYQPEGSSGPLKALMPIIDFLNHDVAGCPFLFASRNQVQTLRTLNYQPIPGSNECLMSYGYHDALDSFILFGFVATTVPFVRSVPLEVKLPGGRKLVIEAVLAARNDNQLHPSMQDLRNQMPITMWDEDGSLRVSHLMIPVGEQRDGLRRILKMLLPLILGAQTPPAIIKRQVRRVEAQILEANCRFYESLLEDLGADPESDKALRGRILDIARLQLAKLRKYAG